MLEQVAKIFGMPSLKGARFVSLSKPLIRVRPDDFEQSVARSTERSIGNDQRTRDELGEQIQHIQPVNFFVACKRGSRFGREAAAEDREPAQHSALGLGEQAVAPVERGTQRFLAGERSAPAKREQAEALVELLAKPFEAERRSACRRHLDCELHAIEPTADRRQRSIGAVQAEAGTRSLDTIQEQLNRLRAGCNLGACCRIRQRKGGQWVDLLPSDAQRLAAGRDDGQLISGEQKRASELCTSVEQVLAIVEQQQHLT